MSWRDYLVPLGPTHFVFGPHAIVWWKRGPRHHVGRGRAWGALINFSLWSNHGAWVEPGHQHPPSNLRLFSFDQQKYMESIVFQWEIPCLIIEEIEMFLEASFPLFILLISFLLFCLCSCFYNRSLSFACLGNFFPFELQRCVMALAYCWLVKWVHICIAGYLLVHSS